MAALLNHPLGLEVMVIDPSQYVPQDCGTRCRMQYAIRGSASADILKKKFRRLIFLKSLLIVKRHGQFLELCAIVRIFIIYNC